jgi:uncharacterized protein (TIGR02001 family)
MTGAAWATTAILLTAAAPVPLRAAEWGTTLTLASQYVFRGVTRTDGAAVQGGLHVRSAAGGFAGLWASNVDPQPAQIGRVEANVNAGWGFDLGGDWSAAVAWVRYLYPDAASPRGRFDWSEYSASLNYGDRLVLTASVAPEAPLYYVYGTFGHVRATALEASWREPIASGTWGSLALVAALGHYDAAGRSSSPYHAWNLGIAAAAGPFDIALARFGVDAQARREFAPAAADRRWVVSVTWRHRRG